MQKNMLLIGLGGTGCAVVRELKKKLHTEWKVRGNTGAYPDIYEFPGQIDNDNILSRIATLSIDSNEGDLNGEGDIDTLWRSFGENLRLRDNEKILLDSSAVGAVVQNVQRYPGVSPWIENEIPFVREITRGLQGGAGCNQIRRLGRLCLASGNNMQRVIDGIADRLNRLAGDGGERATQIHIACSLATGTGGGTILDVTAQLQRYLQDRLGCNVFLHTFVTAQDVNAANAGNFYINEYAALKELNAFRLGDYSPWDIMVGNAQSRRIAPPRMDKQNYPQNIGQIANTFASLSLISDTTSGGVAVPLPTQIGNVAEFLFQLYVRQLGSQPVDLRKALTLEDRADKIADEHDGSRATSFMSYGVQRVAIPEREIQETLSIRISRQFVLQLLYNNWDGTFNDIPLRFDQATFVAISREAWGATKSHLNLDIVPPAGNVQFPIFNTDWANKVDQCYRRTLEIHGDNATGRSKWIVSFNECLERYWLDGFRLAGDQGGVENYFNVRSDAATIRTFATSTRQRIERALLKGMEDFKQGCCLHNLPIAVDFLIQQVQRDIDEFANDVESFRRASQEAYEERQKIETEFSRCGIFTLAGKYHRLFTAHKNASYRYYLAKTQSLAAVYGMALSENLCRELRNLSEQIGRFINNIRTLTENLTAKLDLELANHDDVEYLVDVQAVDNVMRNLFETNREHLEQNSRSIIGALQAIRGNNYTFAGYNQNMAIDGNTNIIGGRFIDDIRNAANEYVHIFHQDLVADNDDFNGLFGQNIVEELYNEYGQQVDVTLENWFRDLINKSSPMLSFDNAPEPLPQDYGPSPVIFRFVFVPLCDRVPNTFHDALKNAIEGMQEGNGQERATVKCIQVPQERTPGEISIISVAFFFPARMARLTQTLKERYIDALNIDAARTEFKVHTESHLNLADLLKPSRQEMLQEQLHIVLLAMAMGLMHLPEAHGQDILFGVRNTFGEVENNIICGMRYDEGFNTVAVRVQETYQQNVSLELMTVFYSYLDRFNEASIREIETLVRSQIRNGHDIQTIETILTTYRGQTFLLAERNNDNAMYQLIRENTDLAIANAQRLLGALRG